LRSSSSFVPNADLDPIGYISALDMLLAVPPDLPVANLDEFVALVKASPGKYVFGSAGVGTPHHMMLEMLNQQAGLKAVHVPYASFQNIIMQVSSGQLNYSFLPPSVMQFVASGKMKILATTAAKRDPAHPEVKTLDELGIKGLSGLIKFFVVAPKGMAPAIQTKLNAAINSVISSEAYAKKVQPAGGVTIPPPLPVAEVTKRYLVEDKRFDALVKDGAIKLD
jgi:tripartite-type tricarboxylate transporter receptor subunit TctC